MAHSLKTATFLMERRIADAERGDVAAYFDLGMAYSAGAGGIDVDLVQAHKWFNLAAHGGFTRGEQCRAEIAEDMTAREIAEAQRQARAWLSATSRRAA